MKLRRSAVGVLLLLATRSEEDSGDGPRLESSHAALAVGESKRFPERWRTLPERVRSGAPGNGSGRGLRTACVGIAASHSQRDLGSQRRWILGFDQGEAGVAAEIGQATRR